MKLDMDMTIGVPYIEEANDKVKLICPVQAGEQKYAWIEVEHKEMSYLVTEVSDAFLAFLYPYAMIHNMDMYFSGKISEDIKYKFNRQIMPIMADNNKIYNRINVYAETSDIKFDNFAVGCGFSGGVDSFNCLIRNTGTEYNDYNITHLCLFDFPIIGGG